VGLRPPPSHDRKGTVRAPFGSPFFRLPFAYLIGVNVFGLVSVLTFVVGALLRMVPVVGLAGLLAGTALGVLAVGVETKRSSAFSSD